MILRNFGWDEICLYKRYFVCYYTYMMKEISSKEPETVRGFRRLIIRRYPKRYPIKGCSFFGIQIPRVGRGAYGVCSGFYETKGHESHCFWYDCLTPRSSQFGTIFCDNNNVEK